MSQEIGPGSKSTCVAAIILSRCSSTPRSQLVLFLLCLLGAANLQAGAETIYQNGIKLRPCAPAQFLQRLGRRACSYIRAVRSHHLKCIGNRYHACSEGNSLTSQTSRVALTIPALIVMADYWDRPLEHLDLANNLCTACSVLLDILEFLPCQIGCFL